MRFMLKPKQMFGLETEIKVTTIVFELVILQPTKLTSGINCKS